jgi:hypothetical protein
MAHCPQDLALLLSRQQASLRSRPRPGSPPKAQRHRPLQTTKPSGCSCKHTSKAKVRVRRAICRDKAAFHTLLAMPHARSPEHAARPPLPPLPLLLRHPLPSEGEGGESSSRVRGSSPLRPPPPLRGRVSPQATGGGFCSPPAPSPRVLAGGRVALRRVGGSPVSPPVWHGRWPSSAAGHVPSPPSPRVLAGGGWRFAGRGARHVSTDNPHSGHRFMSVSNGYSHSAQA